MFPVYSWRSWSLGLLFFFSGWVALVYEVLWHREFSLFFGSGATASAVILVSYFAGLGLGSYGFGKLARRWKHPLVVYGVLEVCIGLGGLMVTPLLEIFSMRYAAVASMAGADGELLLFLKGCMAFGAIAAPTMAMGGTLPVLAEWVDMEKARPGERVGWLYVVNTCGAAVGALAFPLLLLPGLGMEKTTGVCAAGNFLLAGGALALARGFPKAEGMGPVRQAGKKKGAEGGKRLRAPLVLALISGAGTFALQVLWNRGFAQIHENSVFAFALIAALSIAGIALGAEGARVALRAGVNARGALAGFWLGGGVWVAASPAMFWLFSHQLEYLPTGGTSGRLLFLGVLVVLVPMAALSAGLPLIFDEAIRHSARSTGDRTGAVLGVNISGAIAGALLAGFVFPKAFGMWDAVMGVGILFLAAAAWLFDHRRWRWGAMGTAAVAGLVMGGTELPRTSIQPEAGEKLLALAEGAHGVVAVTEREGSRRLKLNNHYLLGGTSSIGDERAQAHLPLLLHPAPRKVALMGYGTGITAGGATFHEGVEATGVELVPEVGRFASEYFAEANREFGTRSGTRLVIEDARQFLRVSGQEYDVILGDLVVPWRPGESALYSREHFARAREALTPDGLLCAWVPMFQVNEAQFQIILNTFLAEFSRAWIWRGDFSPTEPALALMGWKDERRPIQPNTVEARLGKMSFDRSNPHLQHVEACWMHLIGFVEREGSGQRERRIQTEDRPWLELRGTTGGGPFFVGRELQRWEARVRENSREELARELRPEAMAGWEAGAWMEEFTLCLQEGKQSAAREAQRRIGAILPDDLFGTLFGGGPE